MPELPEVETIRQTIKNNQGARMEKIEILHPGVVRAQEYDPDCLLNCAIQDILRRGKYLVLVMANGLNLIVHLGMSGRFYMLPEGSPFDQPHIHTIIHLDNGICLVYQDARRFGGIWFIRDHASFFKHLGVEPLSESFDSALLAQIIKGRKVAIKTLLLNQNLIAGIGNIYADEALFAAGIRPNRPAGSLTDQEVEGLVAAIKKVLEMGIAARGTTFRDFRDGHNKSGSFQDHLNVYGRLNEPCPRCGQLLVRERIGGRSSHYCSHCQN